MDTDMFEKENMNASELLTAFLDGELDASESQHLFYQLANDPELQDEMQELIAMKSAFKDSKVQPPPALKQGVMKNTVMPDTFLRKAATAFVTTSAFLFNKYTTTVGAVLLAGFLTYFIGFDQSSDPDFEKQVLNTAIQNDMIALNNNTSNQENFDNNYVADINPSVPIVSSYSVNSSDNVQSANTNITFPKADKKSSNDQVFAKNYNSEVKTENNSVKKYKTIDFAKPNISSTFLDKSKSQLVGIYFPSKQIRDFLNNVNFEFHKENLYSTPNVNSSKIQEPVLNDFYVSMLYKINDNHSAGLEIGKENFLMQFTDYRNISGRKVLFEHTQSYNSVWGGFAYRYSLDPIRSLNNIKPFAKIMLGGTQVGTLSKLSLGTYYPLNENLMLFASFKYGNLSYINDKKLFFTHKYGFDYGFSISF